MANFRPINSGNINQSSRSMLVKRRIFIFDIPCPHTNNVRQQFDIVHKGNHVRREYYITYSMIGQLARKMQSYISYDIDETTPVRQVWDIPYSNSGVRVEVDFNYHMVSSLDNKMVVEIDYDIVETNPIAGGDKVEFDIVYDLREEMSIVEQTATAPYLTFGGNPVEIINATVGMSEGDTKWVCKAQLANTDTFSSMQRDAPFTVTIEGETWSFIVHSRKQSRTGEAGQILTIVGHSPTAILENPRSGNITKVYDYQTSALSAVRDLADGVQISWTLMNWSIPANVLAFTDVSPMSAIQVIVQAIGGVVESSRSGVLVCRPQYPYDMSNISNVNPSHTFTFNEVLSISDTDEVREIYNCVRIMDADPVFSDQIVWEVDESDSLKGTLKVYLGAPRDGVELVTTKSDIILDYINTTLESVTEVVEIIDSVGSVSKPISNLGEVEWLDTNLGGLSFTFGAQEVKSPIGMDDDVLTTTSLARITYETECMTYNVESGTYNPAQFVLINDSEAQ